MKIARTCSTLGIVRLRSSHSMTLKFFSIYHNTNCQVLYLGLGTCYDIAVKYVCYSDNIQDLLISVELSYELLEVFQC